VDDFYAARSGPIPPLPWPTIPPPFSHALYAANPDAFAGLLTNFVRETFDGRRAENAEQQA
jgi:hypothetical protein